MMSRRFVNALGQMRETARFVHGMMAWAGFRVTMVEVPHGERRQGVTKYNVMRQLSLALYALTSFSTTPLRIASVLGNYPVEERRDMAENGLIRVTCEFCNTRYNFDDAALDRIYAR